MCKHGSDDAKARHSQLGQKIPTAASPIASVATHPVQRSRPTTAKSPMTRRLPAIVITRAMIGTAARPFRTALQYNALIGSK